jgi:hypothetical protein
MKRRLWSGSLFREEVISAILYRQGGSLRTVYDIESDPAERNNGVAKFIGLIANAGVSCYEFRTAHFEGRCHVNAISTFEPNAMIPPQGSRFLGDEDVRSARSTTRPDVRKSTIKSRVG